MPCRFMIFFHQIFVNIQQPATWENLLELVLLQLVHTGAARHNYRFNVEIIERIRYAVEQHAVIRRNFLGLYRDCLLEVCG